MRYLLLIGFFLTVNFSALSQDKTYKIGFLLDKANDRINVLIDDLQEEIIAVVGEDATVVFPSNSRYVNNFNPNLAKEQYNTLVSEVDIVIAYGATTNKVLTEREAYPIPTILFGTVNKDFIETTRAQKINVENFTSIVTPLSYEEDLRIFKELVGCKSVGVLMERGAIQYSPVSEILAKLSSDLELELTLLPFDTAQDVINALEGQEAVYFIGGLYLTEDEIKNIANALIAKKIPSFTTTQIRDVENGLLATNNDQSQIDQFFRRIALSVESVVVDDVPSESSSLLTVNKSLTINFNTAQRIGVPLKYSLIATTNFVGDASDIDADKRYDLVSVMTEVIAENLTLKELQQDVLVSEEDTKFAKSDYLPDVFASASANYTDPEFAAATNGQNPEVLTAGNITLSQTIFSEAANANIGIQTALQQAQQEDYNREQLNIVFESVTAYFNALILKANYKIQSKNLNLTKRNLQIAAQNYDAGQSGKSDVLRFRSELVQNMQDNVESFNQLNQGYYVLNQLLNNPISLVIDVDDAELDSGIFEEYDYHAFNDLLNDPLERRPFIQFLIQEALNNSPELKFLDYNLIATERSEKLFGPGRFLPTVALQGQYNHVFSRSGAGSTFPPFLTTPPDGYYNVGVNLSLPIFNQNKQNINKQIATIQKEQIQFSTENLKLQIEKNINDAVLEVINQITNIELSKVFEETAKEVLELTQTSYENGAVNIIQLLDAQNNYLQAQLASSNATYNYLLAMLTLERYIGNFFLLESTDDRNAFIARFLEFKASIED
ncbi:TolC family protein [Hanstruepera marina]|uniref:TolC family protein n=1 Tax=Hanstruepera marina TaxID=2873265 RepID=UPI001CA77F53|nr:TolC family protein [Hanstruepera marina]